MVLHQAKIGKQNCHKIAARARLIQSGAQVLLQFGAPLPGYILKKGGGGILRNTYLFLYVKILLQQHGSGKNNEVNEYLDFKYSLYSLNFKDNILN